MLESTFKTKYRIRFSLDNVAYYSTYGIRIIKVLSENLLISFLLSNFTCFTKIHGRRNETRYKYKTKYNFSNSIYFYKIYLSQSPLYGEIKSYQINRFELLQLPCKRQQRKAVLNNPGPPPSLEIAASHWIARGAWILLIRRQQGCVKLISQIVILVISVLKGSVFVDILINLMLLFP